MALGGGNSLRNLNSGVVFYSPFSLRCLQFAFLADVAVAVVVFF